MLDHMKNWDKIPFIVFSSSAAVYGDSAEVPIQESSTSQPVNPYGNTKMMIERILQDYDTAYGFRYFNATVAPPLSPQLIPCIFEAYYEGRPFELYGTCARDYIHVSDLSLAHLTAGME